MFIGHCLYVGQTGSGKSTMAKIICRDFCRAGTPGLVLDPLLDPDWKRYGASWITCDRDRFLTVARDRRNTGCNLFLDEAGETIGHNPDYHWFATQSRQWGHLAHFMTQRLEQVSPTVRNQCGHLYVFACCWDDMKSIAAQKNRPEILERPLAPGECYRIRNFHPTELWKVEFAARTARKVATLSANTIPVARENTKNMVRKLAINAAKPQK